jgi:hypothetical protein
MEQNRKKKAKRVQGKRGSIYGDPLVELHG